MATLATPVAAHTIGIRDGGGSELLCTEGELDVRWISFTTANTVLYPNQQIVIYENNCGFPVYAFDFQLSFDLENPVADHPGDLDVDPTSAFDLLQQVMGADTEGDLSDDVFRLYSSTNMFITCTDVEACPQAISEGPFLFSASFLGPVFTFFVNLNAVNPADAALGSMRITAIHSQPVPEPATLVLVGAGLGGLALKRRRSRATAARQDG